MLRWRQLMLQSISNTPLSLGGSFGDAETVTEVDEQR
jgi:hypothetical protein